MALDHAQLESLLCERLCANVRVHRRHDDVLMLESPFTIPDGDHYPIYLTETPWRRRQAERSRPHADACQLRA